MVTAAACGGACEGRLEEGGGSEDLALSPSDGGCLRREGKRRERSMINYYEYMYMYL